MLYEPSQAQHPQTRRHQVSEERILDAATRMVIDQGYDALSMKEVADAADYTAGALYRYFPSKAALLAAVVTRLLAQLADELGALEEAEGDHSALARVAALGLAYHRFARAQPHAFALLSSMLADPRVLLPEAQDRAAVVAAMHRTLMPLARQLGRATAEGQLPAGSTETRALMVFTSLHGALQMGKQERLALLPVATETLVRALLETLLMGLGASRADVVTALGQGQALLTLSRKVAP